MVTLGIWGNALALRLPSHIVKAAGLRSGLEAECRLRDDGSILVRLIGERARRRAAAGGSGTETHPRNEITPDAW